jgi:hypothetical protein
MIRHLPHKGERMCYCIKPTGLIKLTGLEGRGWVYIPVGRGLGSKKGNACLLNGETEKRNPNLPKVSEKIPKQPLLHYYKLQYNRNIE